MSKNKKSKQQTTQNILDIFVIGGGINGTGIARDAAGRGMSVMLVEKDDLASGTSSASTKLIHGGLRYLENYDFKLVRHSLLEREVLLRSAPHIIWPLRFVLPHHRGLRPVWLLRTGLFLYDNIGGRKILPGTRTRNLRKHKSGLPLDPMLTKGFEYSDCWVDDARLVALNAVDAKERGAQIKTRTQFLNAKREQGLWIINYQEDGIEKTVTARALVNAAGPWLSINDDNILDNKPSTTQLSLVKGSHIIVKKIYEGNHAYIFQHPDQRIVFTIPYENDYTLIGTTDAELEGRIEDAAISDTEIEYLCDLASTYFIGDVKPEDVIHTYSGVRGLIKSEDGNLSEVSRDYKLEIDLEQQATPLMNIVGGKITTFRRLSEDAVNLLAKFVDNVELPWTEKASVPGGEIPDANFKKFIKQQKKNYPFLEDAHLKRLCHAYGSRLSDVLGNATQMSELGEHFGFGLTEQEVNYLMDTEFARSVDDVLWRRSKLGLHLDKESQVKVANYMQAK